MWYWLDIGIQCIEFYRLKCDAWLDKLLAIVLKIEKLETNGQELMISKASEVGMLALFMNVCCT